MMIARIFFILVFSLVFNVSLMFLYSHQQARGEGVEVVAGEVVERPSQAGRIRASPAQFANFNASIPPQKSELVSRLFGGLLNLSDTLPDRKSVV